MAPPPNHDALFKATLPKDLLDQLDLTTLVLVSGSFVDEELRASLTDLRFTAKLATRDEALLDILVEHLSQPDAFQALRLPRYEVSIWEA